MTIRIVVTGPECTGKTTLAEQLAESYRAPFVPEAAREYAERVKRPLTADDTEPIARRWMVLADAAARSAPALVVHDTDLISTVAYSRAYYGSVMPFITEAARERVADFYLLCGVDIAWVADGVRDRPDDRDAWLGRFRDVLAEFGARSALVSGVGTQRLDAALSALSANGFGSEPGTRPY